jgi:hypothetical protein
MTWYASSTNRTNAENAHVEIVTFAALDLPSGVVRVHTRTGTITWGSNDYVGVGKFGAVSDVTEDAQLRPSGVSLTLSGVDAALITAAMTEKYHGRAVSVWQGFLNTTTLALVADPQLVFSGLMDYMSIELGQNTGSIVVSCEGELARWNRHNGALYTHESQQAIYPGDRGFDLVPFIQNRTIDWDKTNSPFYRAARGI